MPSVGHHEGPVGQSVPDGTLCSDEAVLRSGDDQGFAALVKSHENLLAAALWSQLGNTEDVLDALQQVWTNIWKNRQNFREGAKFRSWAYGVARRVVVDVLRERERRKVVSIDGETVTGVRFSELLSDPDPSPEEYSIAGENRQIVRIHMGSLPEKKRRALQLVYMDGVSYEEAARELKMNLNSFYTYMRRARECLRRLLETEIHP